MKEKTKEIVYYFMIFYIVVISILMISSYSKRVTIVTFLKNEDYEKQIEIEEARITKLKSSECKNKLEDLVSNSRKTYYTGEKFLREVYTNSFINKETWLSIYIDAIEYCNITEQTKSKLSTLALTSSIQNDELIQRYAYDYELKLEDVLIRTIAEPSMINVENRIRKNSEALAIELLLNEVGNRK